MSLSDAMSAVSNAQHADLSISNLEKAKRSRSKKRSIRGLRERKNRSKLMTSIIKALVTNAKLKTELALLQEDAQRMKYEKNQLTHDINEFMSHMQQMEHLMRMWIQQMEHQIRMKDSLIKNLSFIVNRLKKATGEVAVQAGMNPQYYGGSAQQQQKQQLQLNQAQQRCPHPPQLQHIMMQQQAAQEHARMQQHQQTVPAQMIMPQSQVQVMMPPQGLGLIPPSWQNVASGSSGGEAASGEGGGDHAPGQGS